MKNLPLTLSIFVSISFFVNQAFAQKTVLRIYTYQSFISDYGPGPNIKKGFEKTCHCIVEFTGFTDANLLLNRLILEGKETPADVVIGLDNNLLKQAIANNTLQEHGLEKPKNLSAVAVTAFHPMLIPFDYGWLAVVYHQGKLKTPITSLSELKAYNPGQAFFILGDPRTSSPGLGFVTWTYTKLGKSAPDFWQALLKNTLATPQGWDEAYQMFLNNPNAMTISYATSPLYHQIVEKRTDIQALPLQDGAFLQVEYAGITRPGNKMLGQSFLKYLLSDAVQNIIPETQWMFPATNVALPTEFQTVLEQMKKYNQLSFPTQEAIKSTVTNWQSQGREDW